MKTTTPKAAYQELFENFNDYLNDLQTKVEREGRGLRPSLWTTRASERQETHTMTFHLSSEIHHTLQRK